FREIEPPPRRFVLWRQLQAPFEETPSAPGDDLHPAVIVELGQAGPEVTRRGDGPDCLSGAEVTAEQLVSALGPDPETDDSARLGHRRRSRPPTPRPRGARSAAARRSLPFPVPRISLLVVRAPEVGPQEALVEIAGDRLQLERVEPEQGVAARRLDL